MRFAATSYNLTRTSPSREGIVFILITLVIGFAALNTGNNLLYLIFSIMLGFVAVSGVMSTLNLSSLDIWLGRNQEQYALTPGNITLKVRNKWKIPVYSVIFQVGDNSSYIPFIPAGSERTLKIGCFFKARGWNDIPDAIVKTRFPFRFFLKWKKIELPEKKLLVYPKITRIKTENTADIDLSGDRSAESKGVSTELKSIREYSFGDNTRYIDWKKSASSDRLMVREFYSEKTKTARIYFNPEDHTDNLEQYISIVASKLAALLAQGADVEFITEKKIFFVNRHNSCFSEIMRFLALY